MKRLPKIGFHVSGAGGLEKIPAKAAAEGAECFQFFSRSPRGGAAAPITQETAASFQDQSWKLELASYIHTPYYINFGSIKEPLAQSATRIVREELKRGSLLGVKYVVTHLGSAIGWPRTEAGKTPTGALDRVVEGVKGIFEAEQVYSSNLLLEIAAGAGAIIGDSFEELAYILDGVGREDIGVCLDTCHMLAIGYDMRTSDSINQVMKEYERIVGFERLKLVHVNDSKAGLGEKRDKHEHIGKGMIGEDGFKAMLKHPDLRLVNFVLETPHDGLLPHDLELLKKWREEVKNSR